ncbi:MAG: hypothetical protein NZ661_10810, partial [Candidatus Kapabacteria bacterium]|nr:hypothetical protein [Candidatus Kapabacteria bacterium]
SMSIDPFTQRTTNEFIMTAYAVCASATAAIRFLQFLNILPELTILFRGNLPIRLQYDANIDVFETQGAAQPLRGTAVSTYTVPEERLLSFFELGAEIGILTFTVGNGTCSFHMQGAMALSQLVRPIPLLQIPNYYNIIGRDPLAGYRTLNVQPISVSLGLRYMLHDIGW